MGTSSRSGVVLCAGRGSRLGAVTEALPKPLVLVAGASVLDSILHRLRAAGVADVAVAAHHRAERILDAMVADDAVEVVLQDRLNGPAGSLLDVLSVHRTADRIVVVHGDVWSDVRFEAVLEHHERQGADATVVGFQVEDVTTYGTLRADEGRLTALGDKGAASGPGLINAGAYVFEREALALDPPWPDPFDFHHVFARLIEQGRPVAIYEHRGRWHDVGTPASLLRANLDALADVDALATTAAERAPGLWVVQDRDGSSAAGPHVRGRSLVFASASIGPDVTLDAAVVGPGAVVGEGARVTRSVLLPGARVDPGATIDEEVCS